MVPRLLGRLNYPVRQNLVDGRNGESFVASPNPLPGMLTYDLP